jgi:flagellar biosynthesis protein
MADADKPRLAVALTYEKPHAPRVVAKGRGELGQQIIDLAHKHGVPMEQNPALAEALSHVELDEHIPKELYRAVATVLGFILRASCQVGRASKASPRPPTRPYMRP